MTTVFDARTELISNLRSDYLYESQRATEALEMAQWLIRRGDSAMAYAVFNHHLQNLRDAEEAKRKLRKLGAEI
jgi:hypothetical protein